MGISFIAPDMPSLPLQIQNRSVDRNITQDMQKIQKVGSPGKWQEGFAKTAFRILDLGISGILILVLSAASD